MPNFCAVVKCGSKSGTKEHFSFYRIPSVSDRSGKYSSLCNERRQLWMKQLRREDINENKIKSLRICSKHFISGKPAELYDKDNPDWIPTINMGYISKKNETMESRMARYDRKKSRKISVPENKNKSETTTREEEPVEEMNAAVNNETEISLKTELEKSLDTINKLEKKIFRMSHNLKTYEGNDALTCFYTGLESYELLKSTYDFIKPYLRTSEKNRLKPDEQLILTLMKLRHNFLLTDLAYRFDINRRSVSKIFYECLNILYYRLKWLVHWPDRDELQSTVPECFKEVFGNKVTCIIDCFEVFTEKPSNVDAHAKMFSHYKHHQTVKFLIAISPQGTIMFISEAYGGKASDKHITETSGFLNNLLAGDLVLADRGFLISEVVGERLAEVKTPAFLKGKMQMPPKHLEQSRKLSRVRVHVERVIGCLQQKYTIFNKFIQMDLIKYVYDDNISALDKLVVVCSALVNLNPSVVVGRSMNS